MRLIKADLFRLFKGKLVYIVLLMIVAILTADLYLKEAGNIYLGMSASTTQDITGVDSITEYHELLGISLARNSSVIYLPIVFLVLAICVTEFSHNTIRNTLISPVDKKKYYFAKLGFCCLTALALYFLYMFGGYLSILLIHGSSYVETFPQFLQICARQIPIILAITSVVVMLAFLLKKTASYITITLLMATLFQSLFLLLQFINDKLWLIRYNISTIVQYEFSGMLNLTGSITLTNQNLMICILLSICYIIASTFIGVIYFTHQDLK